MTGLMIDDLWCVVDASDDIMMRQTNHAKQLMGKSGYIELWRS